MADSQKSIVLITGGNAGIGFEIACQLLSDQSKHIIIGSRSIEKGEAALSDLKSRKPLASIEMVQLDVTSRDSVQAAAKKIEAAHGRLDTLCNNAGMFARKGTVEERYRETFETNCIGVVVMVEEFASLLKKSKQPRIVTVSSIMGSIGSVVNNSVPYSKTEEIAYRSSKSALNMISACQAAEYKDFGFKVFCVCPGFTISSLGPFNDEQHGAKPTSEGAKPIVAAINGEKDDLDRGFFNAEGVIPF